MRLWTIWIAALLPALAVQADTLSRGQQVAEAFLAGDAETVWAESTPEMRQAIGSADSLAALRDKLTSDFGTEEEILSEQTERRAGHEVYTRLSRWTNSPATMEIIVALDPEERIAGLFVRPQPSPAPSSRLDYETKAALRLPVEGEWYVYWGGREVADNRHAVDPGQRFALDLLVRRGGQSHAGDPTRLESYHCWGLSVLAPAEGVVARVVDGLPDQPIGEADAGNPAGNHVVIDFGNDEYGFLAHLQQGSLRVAEGDRVAAGEEIGLCGNSGNTSEPHLHFHLQTSPELGRGEGLPAQFVGYLADGRPVERGEPKKGETIRPAD